jgi:hypothetical protein
VDADERHPGGRNGAGRRQRLAGLKWESGRLGCERVAALALILSRHVQLKVEVTAALLATCRCAPWSYSRAATAMLPDRCAPKMQAIGGLARVLQQLEVTSGQMFVNAHRLGESRYAQ